MKKLIAAPAALAACLIIVTSGCVTPRETAQAGAFAGRRVGTVLGFVATTLDESVQYAAEAVQANPRYDAKQQDRACQSPKPTPAGPDHRPSRFIRADVIIETDSPTNLRSITMRESEDITEFWQERR